LLLSFSFAACICVNAELILICSISALLSNKALFKSSTSLITAVFKDKKTYCSASVNLEYFLYNVSKSISVSSEKLYNAYNSYIYGK